MYGRAHAGIPARAGLGVQPGRRPDLVVLLYLVNPIGTTSALLHLGYSRTAIEGWPPDGAAGYHDQGSQMSTRELRFAFDEKGIKTFAPSLVGQVMTYWEDDRRLVRGRVTAAEVKRDRYGNPYVEVELEPVGAPA
jgi:hypothetical protein